MRTFSEKKLNDLCHRIEKLEAPLWTCNELGDEYAELMCPEGYSYLRAWLNDFYGDLLKKKKWDFRYSDCPFLFDEQRISMVLLYKEFLRGEGRLKWKLNILIVF